MNSDHTITGSGSSTSPLSGYTTGVALSIDYQASVSGTLHYDFNLYDMMGSGAVAYVTLNGSYLDSTVLYASGMSLTGTTAISAGDTLQIYFNIGSGYPGMTYMTINSIYIAV